MTPADDDLPEFPPENEWLACTPPDVAPDFAGRMLARLRDVGLVAPDARAAHDERVLARLDVPREVLLSDPPPPPSPAFVDGVMRALAAQREAQLTSALPAYRLPDPSPEFVARTLAALRRERRPARLHVLRSRVALLAAVLLVGVLLAVLAARSERVTESRIAANVGAGLPAEGPSLLAALVQAAERDDDDLPLLAATASPWPASSGAGR